MQQQQQQKKRNVQKTPSKNINGIKNDLLIFSSFLYISFQAIIIKQENNFLSLYETWINKNTLISNI